MQGKLQIEHNMPRRMSQGVWTPIEACEMVRSMFAIGFMMLGTTS